MKPHPASPSEGNIAEIESITQKIMSSSYYEYITQLKEKVKGKIVIKTVTGTSGFVLLFSDNSWVAAYLNNMQLHWQIGKGENLERLDSLLNSTQYGNGYDPIPENKMYANEEDDISQEIAKAEGHVITGLAIGENCFNFCFKEKMELDTTIVPTNEGKYALRIFWEQW